MITKDASAYNVQFVGTRPVFIDVGSFERLRPGEPWAGYRQFCELFLNPLYLQAIATSPSNRCCGDTSTGSPRRRRGLLGGRGRFRKGSFTHVRLHSRAERRYADADRERDIRTELKQAGFGPKLIDAQLVNLGKAVEGLRWKQQQSTWSDYGDRAHYTDRDLAAKEQFVADGGGVGRAGRVWSSTWGPTTAGSLESPSAPEPRSVVAVDSDDVVVDRLYRDLRGAGEQRILPLILDLADPSPGLGWRCRERPPFVERVRPQLTLCLAVVHHLALTNNVPLDEIVSLLADFGALARGRVPPPRRPDGRPPPGPQAIGPVRRLRHRRLGGRARRRFTVRRREALPGGTRTLYHCTG